MSFANGPRPSSKRFRKRIKKAFLKNGTSKEIMLNGQLLLATSAIAKSLETIPLSSYVQGKHS